MNTTTTIYAGCPECDHVSSCVVKLTDETVNCKRTLGFHCKQTDECVGPFWADYVVVYEVPGVRFKKLTGWRSTEVSVYEDSSLIVERITYELQGAIKP